MKMTKWWVLLLAVGLIFSFAGCDTEGDNNGNQTDNETDNEINDDQITVSFDSFESPSVVVTNQTMERLVAFKNTVSPSTLISGIPAGAANHGLKKDETLFNATGNFVLVLVTEAQYNANKDNLAALENQAFAQFYAFYNDSGTVNFTINISPKLGGQGSLTVNNPTPYNIEIRNNAPTGETLGYVAANSYGNVIRLEAGSYTVFPVLVKYSSVTQELYTAIPLYTSGELEGKPVFQSFSLLGGDYTWNLSELQSYSLTTGNAYLKVINNNLGTGVGFWINGIRQTTFTGMQTVNPGDSVLFSLPFPVDHDGTYPASHIFGQFAIGTSAFRKVPPSQAYELDYIYEVSVTGTDAADFAVGTVTKKDMIDLNQIFD